MSVKYLLPAAAAAVCASLAQQPAAPTRMEIAGMASGVLQETGYARQALAAHDKASASMHVKAALDFASRLEAAGHTGVVPIYQELDQTVLYAPVKGGKGPMTAKRMKKGTNVREVQGEYTSVSVDVAAARDQLLAARNALDSGNLDQADSDLARLQNGVSRKTMTGDLPLLRARENLLLARARVENAKYKDAAAPLRSAADALDEWASLAPGPHAVEARNIRQAMLDLAGHIDKDHADALRLINDWWDQVDTWFRAITQ